MTGTLTRVKSDRVGTAHAPALGWPESAPLCYDLGVREEVTTMAFVESRSPLQR